MTPKVKIIRPAGRELEDFLSSRIPMLTSQGIRVEAESTPIDPNWPYASADYDDRIKEFKAALGAKDSSYIWCARGGYGASDLLQDIPWKILRSKGSLKQHKLIMGYSDISALHCAFYAKLGWVGLHAPMPATSLWPKDELTRDLRAVIDGIKSGIFKTSLSLNAVEQKKFKKNMPISGKLFGGCFSVLTNLIGTPFFPKSLKNHILFFEDTGENPGRLMRQFNQWVQSGVLKGVKALVLGNFRDCAPLGSEGALIYSQFAKRAQIPTFVSPDFGHISLNMPLMVGASAKIQSDEHAHIKLEWQYRFPKMIPKKEIQKK